MHSLLLRAFILQEENAKLHASNHMLLAKYHELLEEKQKLEHDLNVLRRGEVEPSSNNAENPIPQQEPNDMFMTPTHEECVGRDEAEEHPSTNMEGETVYSGQTQ